MTSLNSAMFSGAWKFLFTWYLVNIKGTPLETEITIDADEDQRKQDSKAKPFSVVILQQT
jgi:hypothetical protein